MEMHSLLKVKPPLIGDAYTVISKFFIEFNPFDTTQNLKIYAICFAIYIALHSGGRIFVVLSIFIVCNFKLILSL